MTEENKARPPGERTPVVIRPGEGDALKVPPVERKLSPLAQLRQLLTEAPGEMKTMAEVFLGAVFSNGVLCRPALVLAVFHANYLISMGIYDSDEEEVWLFNLRRYGRDILEGGSHG